MRALTILAALILAAIGGAYGALVASGGGTAVSEPFVVVPVRPPPARGAAPQAAPTVTSQSPVAGAPNANLPAASTGSPAVAGMAATLVGVLLPSSTLTWFATRWLYSNREHPGVRAFKAGLAPISIALILSTSWLLSAAHADWPHDWRLWTLTVASLLLVWRTKVHLLAVLAVGALLGALGLV